MGKRTLHLLTYDRGTSAATGKPKPRHWLFLLRAPASRAHAPGIAHQLRGMPGAFYYPGPEDAAAACDASPQDELEVGEVDEAKLERVHEVLKALRVDQVEASGWNCQDWALEGLRALKGEGLVYEGITPEAVRAWLVPP